MGLCNILIYIVPQEFNSITECHIFGERNNNPCETEVGVCCVQKAYVCCQTFSNIGLNISVEYEDCNQNIK